MLPNVIQNCRGTKWTGDAPIDFEVNLNNEIIQNCAETAWQSKDQENIRNSAEHDQK